jgi:hypothetical protein
MGRQSRAVSRNDLLQELARASRDLGYELESMLEEKLLEVKGRVVIKCLPNESLRDEQVEGFVRLVLDRSDLELAQAVTRATRRVGVSTADRRTMEERQNYRCALCGKVLVKKAEPHVDHIQPIALGGNNELSNYQLLCAECNLGKSNVIAWPLGVPYLDGRRITKRLRYSALARAGGRCCSCGCTSRTAELKVVPIVPAGRGGRMVFDNVRVLCEADAAEIERNLVTRPRRGRRGTRRPS